MEFACSLLNEQFTVSIRFFNQVINQQKREIPSLPQQCSPSKKLKMKSTKKRMALKNLYISNSTYIMVPIYLSTILSNVSPYGSSKWQLQHIHILFSNKLHTRVYIFKIYNIISNTVRPRPKSGRSTLFIQIGNQTSLHDNFVKKTLRELQ